MEKKTKEISVIAYPYAVQYGTILVPTEIVGEDKIKEYVSEHWNDIWFGEPDLDYCGTDFNIDTDED